MSSADLGTKVSIIVPIYKVEKYLSKCIDSLIEQTYTNIEIILVDDGSPDKCPQICDDYAKKDKRIEVIHKENGGLSDARNFGIERAMGEYICFVDSDDWVDADYVESLLRSAVKYKADIAECGYRKYIEEKDSYYCDTDIRGVDLPKVELGSEAAISLILNRGLHRAVSVNKIYKRSLFVDYQLRFPKGRINEDEFTTYKLLFLSNKVVRIGNTLYNYLQRSDSIMGSTFKKNRLDILKTPGEMRSFFRRHNFDADNEIVFYEFNNQVKIINKMIAFDMMGEKEFEDVINSVKANISKINSNQHITKKRKMVAKLLGHPRLYIFIRKLWMKINKNV